MSKPVVAVVVCTLLALATTLVLVPVRWYGVPGPVHPAFDHRWRELLDQDNSLSVEDRDALKRGESVELDLPSEYLVAWEHENEPVPHFEVGKHHRVQWKTVFATQALILLLAGGLLTAVVWRDRRRRASLQSPIE